jgi:hypothetical protein
MELAALVTDFLMESKMDMGLLLSVEKMTGNVHCADSAWRDSDEPVERVGQWYPPNRGGHRLANKRSGMPSIAGWLVDWLVVKGRGTTGAGGGLFGPFPVSSNNIP